ncbi:hypothetical protein A11A3_10182 [Alcanivorax hongdengensis A-11-3]|uniref:Organic solvent tolerance-like N-terminal domain-containing protein n=1 Tax=Alcanivorax hongdengensis A-11-3 TaxID=1177179 RepID=L0WAY8_9GAMM|nr:lipopolysaccharide transport periplasmic protein LptA [Alcanivorax hongdengensis]EKF74179.1 hypothetical protein A11A3_10182 [Alcanivorax hongdengensis A-11-3]
MNSKRHLAPSLLAALLLLPLGAQAEKPGAPIEVSADSGRFEQDAGTGLYQGNVSLIQGDRKMYADTMKLFTKDGELVRVEASGSPVRMEEGQNLSAHANNLEYDVRARTLVLTGDAFVKHQDSTFEGAKVTYNLDNKRVDASGDGDQRVRLVIPAQKSPGETDSAPASNDKSPATDTPQPDAEPATQ